MGFRATLCACALALSTMSVHAHSEAIPGEYIVKFKRDAATLRSAGKNLNRLGLSIEAPINRASGIYKARTRSVLVGFHSQILRAAADLPEIEYIEADYAVHSFDEPREIIPNDPRFKEQWSLRNSGEKDDGGNLGRPGADISATRAWLTTRGSKSVVVAVIDTGIDYTHPDLKDNMWSKPGQPEVHGRNIVTQTDDPMDDQDHGSHCAGIIGATGNNGEGISGVNQKVSLMGVKFLTATGGGRTSDAIEAIDYAVANGVRVINASWGGHDISKALQEAIARAGEKGVTFVAAAGNQGKNNDGDQASYPAGFRMENLVSVASSDNEDVISDTSNYGIETVLLAAPGVRILSTVPGADYQFFSGTSMAAPHVAGAVALLLSVHPELTPSQIKERLGRSVDQLSNLSKLVTSGGRLNVANLLDGDE